MAIAFRAVGTVASGYQVSSLSPGKPSGTQSTDVMILCVALDSSTTTITVTGWTLMGRTSQSTTISAAMYRALGSASAPSVGFSPNANAATCFIQSFSGVDNTTPEDATTVGQGNASSVNITAPSITTVTNGAMAVWQGVILNTNTTATNIEPPTSPNMTETAESVQTTNNNNIYIHLSCAYLIYDTAGPTGTRVGVSGTAGVNVGQLAALKPAGGAAAVVPRRHQLVASPPVWESVF
jgi:hypothetical protein